MANERHTDVRAWEIDSSTRQSVHPHTKYSPFRSALSTTASNLLAVSRGEVATNWVTNPSIEAADITMYTATGSAIAKDTGQQAAGLASLLVNPANSAAGEGFYWDSPVIPYSVHPQFITAQVEHRGASASGDMKLEIRDAAGTTVLATSGTSNLATSWVRVTAQYSIPGSTTPAAYRIYVTSAAQHNINFYVDKIMFEVREDTVAVSTYVDGASGLNYSWTGTANASTSLKRPAMEVIRGITIRNESVTAAEIVYVSFDSVASTSTGIAVLPNHGDFATSVYETNFPIDFRENVSVISASGTPTVSGVIWGIAQY
tara:strand:- start:515 stop:1462 length:948 start_codon:yes stop_codon:yes gene_type:complete